jgi:hypothetical protein
MRGQSVARIDHLVLGVADLDRGIGQFEGMTGVRPAYGGRHPTATHNALVSLGPGIYLEIIALQPETVPPVEFAALSLLTELTPVGWAVASDDVAQLRSALLGADLRVTEPEAGSRVTPSGDALGWQTFRLRDNFREAPFFIVWAAGSPHPSATTPSGCTLESMTIASARSDELDRLCSALELPVIVARSTVSAVRLDLTSPRGRARFEFPPRRT